MNFQNNLNSLNISQYIFLIQFLHNLNLYLNLLYLFYFFYFEYFHLFLKIDE